MWFSPLLSTVFFHKGKVWKVGGTGWFLPFPFFCITNKNCEFSLQQSNITEEADFFPEEWEVNASWRGSINPQAFYFVEGVRMSKMWYPWLPLLPTYRVSQKKLKGNEKTPLWLVHDSTIFPRTVSHILGIKCVNDPFMYSKVRYS